MIFFFAFFVVVAINWQFWRTPQIVWGSIEKEEEKKRKKYGKMKVDIGLELNFSMKVDWDTRHDHLLFHHLYRAWIKFESIFPLFFTGNNTTTCFILQGGVVQKQEDWRQQKCAFLMENVSSSRNG